MCKSVLMSLLLLMQTAVVMGQLPLLPSHSICRTSINPSDFTSKSLELSVYGAYSYVNRSYYNGFHLTNNANNQMTETKTLDFKSPNYSQYCVNSVWKGLNADKVGVGFYYINNDLNSLETINTMGLAFAYLASTKNGRFNTGIGIKTNTMKFSKERAYYSFQPGAAVYIQDYSQRFMNFDLGLSYCNDSLKLKVGTSLFNSRTRNYGIKTLDEKYRLGYSNSPALTFSLNKDFFIRDKKKLECSLLYLNSISGGDQYFNANILAFQKWFGLGFQFNKAVNKYCGPIVSFRTHRLRVDYSYNMVIGLNSVLSGYHNLGISYSN